MRSEATPSRSTSLLAAATTVVALMACAQHAGPIDGRLATANEPAGTRMIAVVLAAARDLLLPERTPSSMPASRGLDVLVPVAAPATVRVAVASRAVPQPPLGDRWLDLPPPGC